MLKGLGRGTVQALPRRPPFAGDLSNRHWTTVASFREGLPPEKPEDSYILPPELGD